MNNDGRESILRTINSSLQTRKLYPPKHPSVIGTIRRLQQQLSEFFRGKTKLVVAMVNDELVFDDIPVARGREDYPDLFTRMEAKEIEALIFEKGVSEKELTSFIDVMLDDSIKGDNLKREFSKRDITHVTVRSIGSGKGVFLRVYNDAIEVVKDTMNDIRMGKLPRAEPVKRVVGEMAELVLSDSSVMIGLTMIKNYDNYLYNHSVNVSIIGLSLGSFMGLEKDDLEVVGTAGLLHDIGKTGITEDIIKKPGSLSHEEWEQVKQHPVIGERIIKRINGMKELVARLVYEHHVRYDRTGYPEVKGDVHPLSMIVTIADSYDALTTLRVYQKPYQPSEAVKILKGLSGKHFDPLMVEKFADMLGVYPVGTLVRLSTNEVGVVIRANPVDAERPVVKVVYDKEGNRLTEPFELDLATSPDAPQIVGSADPCAREFDLGDFFTKEVS